MVLHEFPEAGVQIFQTPKGERKSSLLNRKSALRTYSDVRFAGGVLVEKEGRSPVLYTENFYLRFVDSLDPEQCENVIREAGLSVKETLEFANQCLLCAGHRGYGAACVHHSSTTVGAG